MVIPVVYWWMIETGIEAYYLIWTHYGIMTIFALVNLERRRTTKQLLATCKSQNVSLETYRKRMAQFDHTHIALTLTDIHHKPVHRDIMRMSLRQFEIMTRLGVPRGEPMSIISGHRAFVGGSGIAIGPTRTLDIIAVNKHPTTHYGFEEDHAH